LRPEYEQLYADLFSGAHLVRDGILEQQPVARLIDEHRLWLLINSELWYRMMIRGRSREDLQLELVEKRLRKGA
jgi:hypothetical protein